MAEKTVRNKMLDEFLTYYRNLRKGREYGGSHSTITSSHFSSPIKNQKVGIKKMEEGVMKQIGKIEDGMASQGKIKSKGETEVDLIRSEVAFNPPDAELMSRPLQPNEDNDLLREEILEEVEKGETQVELNGREVAFNPPDAELMSGPLQPDEDNDLLREEILDEVENEENQ